MCCSLSFCLFTLFIVIYSLQTKSESITVLKDHTDETLKGFLQKNENYLENVDHIYDKLTNAKNTIDLKLLLKTCEVDLRELLKENEMGTMHRAKLLNVLRETEGSQMYIESHRTNDFWLNLIMNQQLTEFYVDKIQETMIELTHRFNKAHKLINKTYDALHKIVENRRRLKLTELKNAYKKARKQLDTQLYAATKAKDLVENIQSEINQCLTSNTLQISEKQTKISQIIEEAQASWDDVKQFCDEEISIYEAKLTYSPRFIELLEDIITSGEWDFVYEGIMQLKWLQRPQFDEKMVNVSFVVHTNNKHLIGTTFSNYFYKLNEKMEKLPILQSEFVAISNGGIFAHWKPPTRGRYLVKVVQNNVVSTGGIFNATVRWNCQDKADMIMLLDDGLTVTNKYHSITSGYYYLVRANIGYITGVRYYQVTVKPFGRTVVGGDPFFGFATKYAEKEVYAVNAYGEKLTIINAWGFYVDFDECIHGQSIVFVLQLNIAKGDISLYRNGYKFSNISLSDISSHNQWNQVDKLYPAIYMSQSRGIKFMTEFRKCHITQC